MLGANTRFGVTSNSNKSRVKCWPSMDRLAKVGCRQHKQPHRHRNQVEGTDWCGIRSLVSSVSTRFANRRGILTTSNAWAEPLHLQSPLPSKTASLAKERSECRPAWTVPCKTERKEPDVHVQCPSPKDAEGGKDETTSVTCVAESERKDDGMRTSDGDGCSGWWWWDTAWNDLTTVTPADASTFWNELSSWLTTSVVDDDRSPTQTKPNNDNSCDSGTSQHEMSVSSIRDEVTKNGHYHCTGELANAEPSAKKKEICRYDSAPKTALLRAASRGHGDVVWDILRRNSRERRVPGVDKALHDLVNCVDAQVLLFNACCVVNLFDCVHTESGVTQRKTTQCARSVVSRVVNVC